MPNVLDPPLKPQTVRGRNRRAPQESLCSSLRHLFDAMRVTLLLCGVAAAAAAPWAAPAKHAERGDSRALARLFQDQRQCSFGYIASRFYKLIASKKFCNYKSGRCPSVSDMLFSPAYHGSGMAFVVGQVGARVLLGRRSQGRVRKCRFHKLQFSTSFNF